MSLRPHLARLLEASALGRAVKGAWQRREAEARWQDSLARLGNPLVRSVSLRLDPAQFASIGQRSRTAIDALGQMQTPQFFRKLSTFTFRGVWFDRHSGQGRSYREAFHLLPPNIAIVQAVADAAQKPRMLVDFGCGLGNIFGYIEAVSPGTQCFGIDNFLKISRQHVEQYQAATWRRPVDLSGPVNPDWLVSAGIPASWVWEYGRAVRPEVYVLETLSFDLPGVPDGYTVESVDRLVTVLRRVV